MKRTSPAIHTAHISGLSVFGCVFGSTLALACGPAVRPHAPSSSARAARSKLTVSDECQIIGTAIEAFKVRHNWRRPYFVVRSETLAPDRFKDLTEPNDPLIRENSRNVAITNCNNVSDHESIVSSREFDNAREVQYLDTAEGDGSRPTFTRGLAVSRPAIVGGKKATIYVIGVARGYLVERWIALLVRSRREWRFTRFLRYRSP